MGRHGSICVRREQALILRKHIGAVMDVCWSPFEETTLVSASSSSVIYSWDTRTPKASYNLSHLPHTSQPDEVITDSEEFLALVISRMSCVLFLPGLLIAATLSAVHLTRDACVIRRLSGCFCWSWRTCAVHELHVKITCLSTFCLQDPVQKMVVPVKGTTQVSFNRKNAFLLASAFGNEVGIWDVRKVRALLAYFSSNRYGLRRRKCTIVPLGLGNAFTRCGHFTSYQQQHYIPYDYACQTSIEW